MGTTREALGRAEDEGEGIEAVEDAARRPRRSAAEAELLLLQVLGTDADGLLAVARRHSLCFDDAHDAYQRALELFLGRGRHLRAGTAREWLYTVVKNEAKQVQAERRRMFAAPGEERLDEEARTLESPEERVLEEEELRRAAEVLNGLKAAQSQALLMHASGRSYADIQALTGWTYTKVNRSLREGRQAFARQLARLESGEECQQWAPTLADMVAGKASEKALAELRPHLTHCQSCKATVRALHAAERSLAALAPVVAVGGVSEGAGERATSLLARVHDALASHLTDRAAAAAIKAQPLLEVTTATKVAAVAASAAVVAGGGVAVHEQTTEPPPPRAKPAVREAAREPFVPPAATTTASAPAAARATAAAVRADQQVRAGSQLAEAETSRRRQAAVQRRAERRRRAAVAARKASEQFDPDLTPAPKATPQSGTPAAPVPPAQQFTPPATNPLSPPPRPSSPPPASPKPSDQFSTPSNQFG